RRRAFHGEHRQYPGDALVALHPERQQLTPCFPLELPVDDQPADAALIVVELMADRRAVERLVDEAAAGALDDHALDPRAGRIEEAPAADMAQALHGAARRLAHTDAAAVVARIAHRRGDVVLRRVVMDHRAVVDEPARAEAKAGSGADAPRDA